MNWTTPKIVTLVVATSLATSICDHVLFLHRNSFGNAATPAFSAMMEARAGVGGGANPQFETADAQELSDLQSKVKERQEAQETTNAITVDLKRYINCQLTDPLADEPAQKGHTLAELPKGAHTYGGVPFDVQGIVQLNGPSIQGGNKLWPLEVPGIAVNHTCKKIHLLHSAFHIDGPATHTAFAKLTLHYADGSKEEIELAGGIHALRCTSQTVPPNLSILDASKAELGWLGSNPYLRKNNPGASLHLYRCTLDNPKPDLQLTTVDYQSTMVNPAPFLVALTVE